MPTWKAWPDRVVEYGAAMAASDEAFAAYDALDPSASEGAEEERRYEAAWAAFEAAEDRLLGVVAPDLAGVSLQLRAFAERFHGAELCEPEMAGEDRPAGEILRRILLGIEQAAEARGTTP